MSYLTDKELTQLESCEVEGIDSWFCSIWIKDTVKDLVAEIREYRKLNCRHPGCGCVCNHQGLCPEDGPINGGKNYPID
jgi:hypothetical protein